MKKGFFLLGATIIVMLLAATLFLNKGDTKSVEGKLGTAETSFQIQTIP